MKKKYLLIAITLAALIFFSVLHYNDVKIYYEEILDTSGLNYENFEEKLKQENDRAVENEAEYEAIKSGKEAVPEEAVNTIPKDLRLHARACVLLDASNNRVLYEENGLDEMPNASTTKIMTCIVALENAKPDDIVTVSSYAARMPDVQLTIRENEQYYLKDLLYSLMLESHNDTAVAIAEHVGGTVEGFATMMNDKARSLGCENTNFITPNGLDAQGHYTTAKDLAIIASYAIKNDQFIEITNTSSHQFKEINNKRSFTVRNKNRFLYMMEGAIGVKTGFTNDAGYCFVGAVKRLDRTLVSVVLGCGWPPSKNLKWQDTEKLMDYGIKNYDLKQIYEDKSLDPVFVNNGRKKKEALKMNGDLRLLMREDETVTIEYSLPEILEAPVEKNKIVGYAKYYINNVPYTEIPIYTTEEIKKINYMFCLKKILKLWGANY